VGFFIAYSSLIGRLAYAKAHVLFIWFTERLDVTDVFNANATAVCAIPMV
jgi:hypothetical protein